MRCAFDRNIFCTVLTEKQCKGCSFYKTHEELDAGREKAEDRIAKLPEAQQEHIRFKYHTRYSSSMWEEQE